MGIFRCFLVQTPNINLFLFSKLNMHKNTTKINGNPRNPNLWNICLASSKTVRDFVILDWFVSPLLASLLNLFSQFETELYSVLSNHGSTPCAPRLITITSTNSDFHHAVSSAWPSRIPTWHCNKPKEPLCAWFDIAPVNELVLLYAAFV